MADDIQEYIQVSQKVYSHIHMLRSIPSNM